MLTYLGMKVSDNWEKIQKQLHYLDYVVVLAVVGAIIWLVVRRRRTAAAER
jgi:membrane protein DedA with SNARE-associated domain